MSRLKLLFMMNAEQIRTYFRLVHEAEGGDGAAACRLGDMYRESLGGLRYSPKQALRLFRLAVEQGEEKARPEVERLAATVPKTRIRFVDATVPGRHYGLVGVAGVAPPTHAVPEEEGGDRA